MHECEVVVIFYLLEEDARDAEVFVEGLVVHVSVGGEVEGEWGTEALLVEGGLMGMGILITAGIGHFGEFVQLSRGGGVFSWGDPLQSILEGTILNPYFGLMFMMLLEFFGPGGA